jgi:hypothetical protein
VAHGVDRAFEFAICSGDTACQGGLDCDFVTAPFGTSTNTIIDGVCGENWMPVSNGYNIESPGNTCGFDQSTDKFNVSASSLKLAPLGLNGGPTETHALVEGSVAIDAIPPEMCEVGADQRGVTRPQGDACDVGAFELEVAP